MTPADDLKWLVAVVDAGSFRGAAETHNVTSAAVSKRIKLLEDRLGARLLTRTTRQVRLTDAGDLYYRRGKHLLEALSDLEESVRDSRAALEGTLRVNASLSYAQTVLVQPLLSFLDAHPRISLSLTLDDSYVDVAAGHYDVVIRLGTLVDSSLIARPITEVPILCCVSPHWLDTHGTPREPNELNQLPCLAYEQPGQPTDWTFERAGESVVVRVSSRLGCNNGEILRDAAIAGHGVALLPAFIAAEALDQGSLVPILEAWTSHTIPVNAVYPSRDYLPQKVSRFIDHLRDALAG